MTEISSFLNTKNANFIKDLTEKQFENFKTAKSDSERIKILYSHVLEIKLKPLVYGKSLKQAEDCKKVGVLHFSKKRYTEALNFFSNGIINCPESAEDELKFKTILIANRSATLFELKEYEKTLEDIDYAIYLDAYPAELKYKLLLRKIKCYQFVKTDQKNIDEIYQSSVKSLHASDLENNIINSKLKELDTVVNKINNLNLKPSVSSMVRFLNSISTEFRFNNDYKNASEKIDFDYQTDLGRYAKAKSDIEPGTVIIMEDAYCAVLENKFLLSHCHHCMLPVDIPVPCGGCSNIIFCSLNCLKNSLASHKNECGVHSTLSSSGLSINCCMALKIITQRNLQYFKSHDFTITRNNDLEYSVVYALCRNEAMRNDLEYFHYTIMAIYLLRLLKLTTYFDNVKDDVLTEDEALIGSLILCNLQILQFNAHEISEIKELKPRNLDSEEPLFNSVYVGGGLYPTLALFNHSCDPGIVRFNIGSKIIVKTIKPIKQGEIVYENYGPIYTTVVRSERQKFLQKRYWFTCSCKACEENWPLFDNMTDEMVKIGCRKCEGYVLLHNNLDNALFSCNLCKSDINMFVHLKALSELETILQRAEDLYKHRQFSEACNLFLSALRIYSKHTRPPFPDWVKVQQRLRTCFILNGNKSIELNKKI